MSGFSSDWLGLREPFDHAARSDRLTGMLTRWADGREGLVIADMGSGTGSNFRAIEPVLPPGQHWYLLENDPALIEAGRSTLPATGRSSCLYVAADLSSSLEDIVPASVDIVTCSALLDLVSMTWLERLVRLVIGRKAALLAVLTYDDRIRWRPGDLHDTAMRDLFNRHQRTDKGFGPALGGSAAGELETMLKGKGQLSTEPSPWVFRPGDRSIQQALLDGFVAAARELDDCDKEEALAWRNQRRTQIDRGRSHLTVGHIDLLFLPDSR
ncbi:MAG: class I SAM-dependent methyltransferase [Geminicoccaceae bacterium]|nr:class I SAM-dependent methyltransferase [Geminicoccaceae bacterium]